jgi:hypothetical protein
MPHVHPRKKMTVTFPFCCVRLKVPPVYLVRENVGAVSPTLMAKAEVTDTSTAASMSCKDLIGFPFRWMVIKTYLLRWY